MATEKRKPEELAEEVGNIYEFLKSPLAREPMELMDEIDARCGWLARSAEILADAQFIYDKARGAASEDARKLELSATDTREYITGKCADENRLLKQAERLNSTIVHQLDAARSILSFNKQEMATNMRTGGGA